MENLQQSLNYQKYLNKLGWHIDNIDNIVLFRRSFPLYGALVKIQRNSHLPDIDLLINYIKNNKVNTLAIEPEADLPQDKLTEYIQKLKPYVNLNKSPFIATKTIRVDLKPHEDAIFKSFAEAKRRAVRRSANLGVSIKISNNIQELIFIKNKSAGFMGFITTHGSKELFECFYPNTGVLIAYDAKNKPIGGIFMIIHKDVCFYWLAGATRYGKGLFAPTLLAWEAIKYGKSKNCHTFDFVGVWDERIPKYNPEWKGFTKFKEGFGGFELYYPISNNK